MPHERFFVAHDLHPDTTVVLEEAELHHLRVLRLKTGAVVELINGRGTLATAKILKDFSLHILTSQTLPPPTPLLSLAIPLLRPSKLEWTLEKATEIGADRLLLYTADFSEKMTLSSHQQIRLHNLLIAALKQSGRLHLPTLEILPHFPPLGPHTYFGDPTATTPFVPPSAHTLFITGPEKGFSPKELSLLREGASPVRLGPYILRAETAPLVAASIAKSRIIPFIKNRPLA